MPNGSSTLHNTANNTTVITAHAASVGQKPIHPRLEPSDPLCLRPQIGGQPGNLLFLRLARRLCCLKVAGQRRNLPLKISRFLPLKPQTVGQPRQLPVQACLLYKSPSPRDS